MRGFHDNRNGFSLVELMIVIGIISIILAISAPGILSWLPSYRLKGATQDLLGNFQLAKLTAIKRNAPCAVVFHQNVDGTDFDALVFVEADATANLEYDAGERIIARFRLADYGSVDFDTEGGDAVTFEKNDDGLPAVAYRPNGLVRDNAGALESRANAPEMAINLINTNGTKRRLVMSRVGNLRVE